MAAILSPEGPKISLLPPSPLSPNCRSNTYRLKARGTKFMVCEQHGRLVTKFHCSLFPAISAVWPKESSYYRQLTSLICLIGLIDELVSITGTVLNSPLRLKQ